MDGLTGEDRHLPERRGNVATFLQVLATYPFKQERDVRNVFAGRHEKLRRTIEESKVFRTCFRNEVFECVGKRNQKIGEEREVLRGRGAVWANKPENGILTPQIPGSLRINVQGSGAAGPAACRDGCRCNETTREESWFARWRPDQGASSVW